MVGTRSDTPHGGPGMCTRCYCREFQVRARILRKLHAPPPQTGGGTICLTLWIIFSSDHKSVSKWTDRCPQRLYYAGCALFSGDAKAKETGDGATCYSRK